ncbi:hypothetical protein E2P47_04040 [Candidatus Bathyarchaeota archaeon]|nr:hypothetical protein E2P47_04040 [Candidatus Bathyarchaeota archaeon]
MDVLSLEHLHVKFMPEVDSTGPVENRCYTLTHSDFTGELFLSVGLKFDKKSISGFYTKLMRDEVLAEWLKDKNDYSLHVYCHVSGGIIIGTAGWRDSIFRRELPLVLKCFSTGDKGLFGANPKLDDSPIFVHFKSSKNKYNKVEQWGTPKDHL